MKDWKLISIQKSSSCSESILDTYFMTKKNPYFSGIFKDNQHIFMFNLFSTFIVFMNDGKSE